MARLKEGDILVGWDILPPPDRGDLCDARSWGYTYTAYPVVLRRSRWDDRLKTAKYRGVWAWTREGIMGEIAGYWDDPQPTEPEAPEFVPWKQDALLG